jgi:hypothetical protein
VLTDVQVATLFRVHSARYPGMAGDRHGRIAAFSKKVEHHTHAIQLVGGFPVAQKEIQCEIY